MGDAPPGPRDLAWDESDGDFTAVDPLAVDAGVSEGDGWVRLDDESAAELFASIADVDLGPSRVDLFWQQMERERLERERAERLEALFTPQAAGDKLAVAQEHTTELLTDMDAKGEWINPDFSAQVYVPRAKKLAELRHATRQRRKSTQTAPMAKPTQRRMSCPENRPRARRSSRRPSATRAGPGGDDPGGGEPSPSASRRPGELRSVYYLDQFGLLLTRRDCLAPIGGWA